MKRLHTVLSCILVFAVLAVPAVAQANTKQPAAATGWTWDDASAPPAATADGWTWDEM